MAEILKMSENVTMSQVHLAIEARAEKDRAEVLTTLAAIEGKLNTVVAEVKLFNWKMVAGTSLAVLSTFSAIVALLGRI